MTHRKLTITFILFIALAVLPKTVLAAKSVFIINSQDYSGVQAYLIDGNSVTLQKTTNLPQKDSGAVAIAVWPQKELMFATYDFSSVITWVSTKTLEEVGEFDTGVSHDPGLGGITVDTVNQKIYVTQRGTSNLYVYSYNTSAGTLVPDDNNPHVLANLSSDGAFGITLDSSNGRLYVSDDTITIHYYSTANWAYQGYFDIVTSGVDGAIGIAVDSTRGYLYSGEFYDPGGHQYLVRTSLSSPYTSIKTSVGSSYRVIGVDIDKDTGLIYCTATDDTFRVYNSSLTLLDTKTNVSNSSGSGPAGVAVGGLYKPPFDTLTLEKDDDVSGGNSVVPGNYVTYTISYDANGTAVNDINIVDYLPQEVDFNSASGNWGYDPFYRTVTWNIGDLDADDSGSVTLSVKINKLAEPKSSITNFCEIEKEFNYISASVVTDIGCWKPDIIYVDADRWSGYDTGMSWENAYLDLRDALKTARDCDCNQIWVAKGTYRPTAKTGYDDYFILVDGVPMYGGFAGSETSISQRNWLENETILDGDGDSYYVVYASNLSQYTVLDGLIIKRASFAGIDCVDSPSVEIKNTSFLSNHTKGIYCINSHLTLTNCLIEGTTNGIGIHCNTISTSSTLDLTNCIIRGNFTYGVYAGSSSLTMTDCNVVDNGSDGINCSGGSLTVSNCLIDRNAGKGIYNYSPSFSLITNNVIRRNKSHGIYCSAGSGVNAWLKNNWIHNNGTGDASADGIYIYSSSSPGVKIRNNTIVDNNNYGIEKYSTSGVATISNCILWGNDTGQLNNNCTATYSCIQNWTGGGTNISSDPCFVYAGDTNDYHIARNSLCIDAGDAGQSYDGETDIDGEPRVMDGDGNDSEIVDMGADEFSGHPADYNRDGTVNFLDYAIFANAWHTNNAAISLDSNSYVDMCDLRIFNDAWLWQAGWLTGYKCGCTGFGGDLGDGGLGIEQESAQYEQIAEEQAEQSSVPTLDIDQIIGQLEGIWQQDADLRLLISEAQWQEFIDSLEVAD
jgi:hypothetical protein